MPLCVLSNQAPEEFLTTATMWPKIGRRSTRSRLRWRVLPLRRKGEKQGRCQKPQSDQHAEEGDKGHGEVRHNLSIVRNGYKRIHAPA